MVGRRLHTSHRGRCYTDVQKTSQHAHARTHLRTCAGMLMLAYLHTHFNRTASLIKHIQCVSRRDKYTNFLTRTDIHTRKHATGFHLHRERKPHTHIYYVYTTFQSVLKPKSTSVCACIHIHTIKTQLHRKHMHRNKSSWPCKHTHLHTFLQCFVTNKPPCSVCSGELSPSGAQCSFSGINHADLSRTLINHLGLGVECVFVCACIMCTETCMLKFCWV